MLKRQIWTKIFATTVQYCKEMQSRLKSSVPNSSCQKKVNEEFNPNKRSKEWEICELCTDRAAIAGMTAQRCNCEEEIKESR